MLEFSLDVPFESFGFFGKAKGIKSKIGCGKGKIAKKIILVSLVCEGVIPRKGTAEVEALAFIASLFIGGVFAESPALVVGVIRRSKIRRSIFFHKLTRDVSCGKVGRNLISGEPVSNGSGPDAH